MILTLLKSKLHRATITGVDIDYEGSLEIDAELMQAADILYGEQVHVFDVTNGARFTTYAVPGPAGGRGVRVLGAAGRLVVTGDIVLVLTFAQYDEKDLADYKPKVIRLGAGNRVEEK
ncbi:aspartate 1-decarboxylase [bacterium]|nr:aspartate 1-decarboxylase [bacterium]